MKTNKRTLLLSGVSAVAVLLSGGAVFAQDNSRGSTIEEVLVTATKRQERVLDVPVAITAYTSEFAERMNIDNSKDLIKFTPGMAGDSQDSFVDYVNIRGISTNDFGNGGDPSVGFFKNGLYQGRTGSATTSIYDIERAEVLRGPQGFLFGRNAISGAISVHTARPDFDDTSYRISGGAGERGILEGQAMANFAMAEDVALRVALYRSKEDGYITNTVYPDAEPLYGHNKKAGRISLAIRRDNWDMFMVGEAENKMGSGTAYRAVDVDGSFALLSEVAGFDVAPNADPRTISSDMGLGNDDHAKIYSVSNELNVEFGMFNLLSLTGYKEHSYSYAEDYDGMAISFYDYAQDQKGDYFEQELRATSNSEGPLSWYVGGSYFKENIDTTFRNHSNEDILCGAYYYSYYGTSTCEQLYDYWGYPGFATSEEGLIESNRIVGEYHGWGAYADLTYQFADNFDMSFGARYSSNTKDFGIHILPVTSSELGPWYNFGAVSQGFLRDERTWENLSPRMIARYRPSDQTMIYASVTKGWKSGGYNSFGYLGEKDDNSVVLPGGTPDPFEPEVVWSYELGMKGTNAAKTIRYDVVSYYYQYRDMQLNYWDAGTKVDNIGKVKSWGLEGSLQAVLSDNMDLLFSGSYNHNKVSESEFIEAGSTGNRLPGAPKLKASGMINYHTRITETGELNASADFSAQSSYFSAGLANQVEAKLNGYSDVSLRLGYQDDAGWSVTAYVENVFDSVYWDGGYEGENPLTAVIFGVSRPRTVGMRFSYDFGQ